MSQEHIAAREICRNGFANEEALEEVGLSHDQLAAAVRDTYRLMDSIDATLTGDGVEPLNGDPIGPNGPLGRLVAFPRAIGFEREAIWTSRKDLKQNGPTLRRKAWKYRHIPAPFLLALSHFASNLNGASKGA